MLLVNIKSYGNTNNWGMLNWKGKRFVVGDNTNNGG